MLMRVFAACALLLPVAAVAQVRPAAPVIVEVIAIGEIDAPATYLTMTATWSSEAKTQELADRAKIAKLAEVLKALQAEGVPNSAVTALAADEPLVTAASPNDLLGLDADDEATDAAAPADPVFTASDSKSIRVTSLVQANAARDALEALGVTVSEPKATLDDQPAVYRQAKTLALRNARLDGDAYAREMGMRVARVSRISEAGNNLLLPGWQEKAQRMMNAGPTGIEEMFKSKPGTVRVEATLVVEFVLTP